MSPVPTRFHTPPPSPSPEAHPMPSITTRFMPSAYGQIFNKKRELEEVGLFNIQASAAHEIHASSNENVVRYTIKAMLAALSPVPAGEQGHRYLPVILPEFGGRKVREGENIAPAGWTWVFYTLTVSSSVSYDHAAVELLMLTQMYIATKEVHQAKAPVA